MQRVLKSESDLERVFALIDEGGAEVGIEIVPTNPNLSPSVSLFDPPGPPSNTVTIADPRFVIRRWPMRSAIVGAYALGLVDLWRTR